MVRLESEDFIDGVKQIIAKDCRDEDANIVLVWLNKTIQNWKGLFYCLTNKKYYEATFNGDKDELYLDCYNLDNKKVFEVTASEKEV
jgi:hypothetical protein